MFPIPQLEPDSGEPLYRQVYDYIRDLIRQGRLSRGERLPATRELAGLLGLNRTTVSAAYGLLESEGLIRGHVGRGSFVNGGLAAEPQPVDWDELLSSPNGRLSQGPPSVAQSREAISFATSRPSEKLFPLEQFRASCREVIAGREAASILQLGSPGGYGPLRDYLLEEAQREGAARSGDDILITNGCQQAIDLLGRILITPGDLVAVEDPVYPGLHQSLAGGGARLAGIPVGPEGMERESLERLLAGAKPRVLVLTPNFQNPTGATLPLEARKAILRMARNAGTVVVENDIYGDLRYEGGSIPTMKQLDEGGDVILLRSFSKVAFPGLRVGWVIAPRAVIGRLIEAKQWCDLHTDQLSQAVLLRFAESGRLGEHRAKVQTAGRERLRAALEACAERLPHGAQFTRPSGGMSLWVRLPEPLDAGELLARAEREQVTYLPGKYFTVSRPDPGSLRLSFAGLAPERIRKGIGILGELFGSELERVRAARRADPAPAIV